MTKNICIIPARMGSSRFPGKPLELINGYPMIEHVYKRSALSNKSNLTVVATCDREIYNYVESFGGNAIFTSSDHQRASDRCAEALHLINSNSSYVYNNIVMVQGDEPLVHPDLIDNTFQLFELFPNTYVSNIVGAFLDKEEFDSNNSIKVVSDLNNNALYFSRSPIPFMTNLDLTFVKKQVCIIGFTNLSLTNYSALMATRLEVIESIDMLRVLQHGLAVKLIDTSFRTLPVDIPSDVTRLEPIIALDPLFNQLF